MTPKQLAAILARGEDSHHQFKRDFSNTESMAAELAAFANMGGGMLLVGICDDGTAAGLTVGDIGRLNQILSNAASQHVKPPLNPLSTNVQTEHGLVMLIEVQEGLNKPYVDSNGRIWVKAGADKRQVTAREEMQRMFQQSGLLHADEQAVSSASLDHIDHAAFTQYFERRYQKPLAATGLALPQLLQNLNLTRNDKPNLAGMMLFGSAPHIYLPAFTIKAAAFPGTVLHSHQYLDSETIEGTLAQQYQHCMAFLGRNLHHVQGDRGFNSPGQLEIPHQVLEEILVNALVHRDYLINAPIRLLIYTDRVEIISPGHLPNHLDTNQIRFGLSNLRNPALASHAFHILPYHGMGSGILRALADWPRIEFTDDRQGKQFRINLKRTAPMWGVNGGVNDLLEMIRKNPGLRAPALAQLMALTPKNIEHRLKKLREDKKIEFTGPPKTGGYHAL
jgi:ATP-dependent DNA helicase RecG